MKISTKWLAVPVLALSLAGGAQAAAASGSFSADSLRNSNGRMMLDVSTYAGLGDDGSKNTSLLYSTFRGPTGLLIQSNGNLLVADSKNHLIRTLSGDLVSTYAGLIAWKDAKGYPAGAKLDGKTDRAIFQEPMGLATDAAGNIYVADAGNHAVRKIDASGNVTTLAGNGRVGSKDGYGTEATFYHPQDVAVSAGGTVYVADTLNHVIRSISPSGVTTTLTAASTKLVEATPGQVVRAGDYKDGAISEAKFNEPSGLALDAKGNLYISDSGNQRIRYMDFAAGTVTTVAGSAPAGAGKDLYEQAGYADGEALSAQFNFPQGIAMTPEGGLIIADSMNHSIRYLLNGVVTTLAGSPKLKAGEADGVEDAAQFQKPMDVAVAEDGSIYTADAFNNKIRKLTAYQLPSDLPQNDEVKVVVDKQQIAFEAQPELENGRTMVPVRAITEALGFQVSYRSEDRAVQLSKGDTTIELFIDKTGLKKLEKNKPDVTKTTDAAPYIKQDLTYVPVRFFAEEMGMDVQWDDRTRTVILRPKTNIEP